MSSAETTTRLISKLPIRILAMEAILWCIYESSVPFSWPNQSGFSAGRLSGFTYSQLV